MQITYGQKTFGLGAWTLASDAARMYELGAVRLRGEGNYRKNFETEQHYLHARSLEQQAYTADIKLSDIRALQHAKLKEVGLA